ncbi:MAG: creatininase family protein [Chloroflexi bacterium]|nr:creatininase family protein [Chloroflexota bacterium]
MRPRTPIWQRLRRDEIAACREAGAVVLLPLGSTEQHGAHLPVDVDLVCVTAVCQQAAEQATGFPILVAPGVWSGYSPHHMDYAGSLTLSVATFQAVVRETAQAIGHHGFDKIILVNGHGGNVSLMATVAAQATTSGQPLAYCSWWDLIKDDFTTILTGDTKGVGHACEAETSLYLHLVGEGVNMAAAVRDDRWPFLPGFDEGLLRGTGVALPPLLGAWTSGVHGDPTQASAEKGRQLVELASKRLADFCAGYRLADVSGAPRMYPASS